VAADNAVGVESDAPPTEKIALWNDPKFRAIFFQILIMGGVLAVGLILINNTMANLERQGIASGFGFLNTTAGFAIGYSPFIEYSEERTYGRAFVVGFLNTILVSVVGIFFATILGFLIGIARLSNNWLISKIATVYIELLRNIPLLLQIFFWYFGVLRQLSGPRQSVSFFDSMYLNNRGLFTPKPITEPGFWLITVSIIGAVVGIVFLKRWAAKRQDETGEQFPVFWTSIGILIGLPLAASVIMGFPMHWEATALKGFNFRGGMEIPPEFVSLLLALAFYTAAFIAEIVRAGIMAVNKGQTEAAYSVGLRPGPTLRLVIIPQALRVIIPPLTSQYLNLTKNSSLAAAIAYPDIVLVFAGTVLMQTGQAVEIMAITMGIYLTLSLLISAFMNWYNKKMALVER